MSVQPHVFNQQPNSENLSSSRNSSFRFLYWMVGAAILSAVVWFGVQMLPFGQSSQTDVPAVNTDTDQATYSVPADSIEEGSIAQTPPVSQVTGETGSDVPEIQAAAVAEPAISTSNEAGAITGTGKHIVAVVHAEDAVLWSAGDASMTAIPAGTPLTAVGRSPDGRWLYVETGDTEGWIAADQVFAFSAASLQVMTGGVAEPAPANTNSVPAATAEPDDVLAQADQDSQQTATSGATQTSPSGDDVTVLATVTLTGARLNVRSGPGTSYAVITKAYPGDVYVASGRNATNDWIQLALPESLNEFGWVSATYVSLDGAIASIPVVATSVSQSTNETIASIPVVTTSVVQATTEVATTSATGLSGTLVFQTGPGSQIYAYDLATDVLWPLTYGFDPAISPDGGTVAFTRDGGESGLYLIDIDGTNERLIYSGSERLSSPKWSPDGNWLVFSRSDDYELILGGPFAGDAEPVKEYNYVLSVVDTNGEQFIDVDSLLSAKAPDWNEGGIVYQSDAGLQWTDITPGTENHLIIDDYLKPFFDDPDWQPGSGWIVYQGKEASHWELFSVAPDGSDVVALTAPSTTLVDEIPSNVAPAWSSDGQSIVFLSNREQDGSAGVWQLWVMDADGGNQRPLPVDVEIDYTFGAEQAVSWGL